MGFDCTHCAQINHFHMRKEVNSSVWFVLFCNVDASWCLMLDHCWCCYCCTIRIESHACDVSRCYLPIQSRNIRLQCFVSSCKHVLHSQNSLYHIAICESVYDVYGNKRKREPIFGMACFGICSIPYTIGTWWLLRSFGFSFLMEWHTQSVFYIYAVIEKAVNRIEETDEYSSVNWSIQLRKPYSRYVT